MQACVSLWSADLLDVGRAVDRVEGVADGFHVDVFDGHNVDELLFGPDFVSALRRRTSLPIDVHLNVTDPDHWAMRFIDRGADMVTVQSGASADIQSTLAGIRRAGAAPSLGVETHEHPERVVHLGALIDRFLLMGTEIGVKGMGLDPRTPQRIGALRKHARRLGCERPIFIDGGIRATIIDALARAGADGVIPGSLVFGADDPVQAIRRLHDLSTPAEALAQEGRT